MADEQEERIVLARQRLRERYLSKRADEGQPRGSGPLKRDGMPKLPPGQTETKGWPVLDLGRTPAVLPSKWELVVDGAVARPLKLSWRDFLKLPQTRDVSDFHCVTTWSKMDVEWEGVQL